MVIITDIYFLRYVGSPYQTSLSEADQVKYLYCLQSPLDNDGSRWKEVEKWPITIGRRYMKVHSLSDPRLASAGIGDKVVLITPIHQLDAADNVARRLKLAGVEVEIRPEKVMFQKSLTGSEGENDSTNAIHSRTDSTLTNNTPNDMMSPYSVIELDPVNLFKQFMEEVNIKTTLGLSQSSNDTTNTPSNSTTSNVTDSMTNIDNSLQILKQRLENEGILLLEKLLSNDNKENPNKSNSNSNSISSSGASHSFHREVRNLQLDRISLKNFGPYGGNKLIHYPITKRGLVLIRGKSSDGTGADSNGSGKVSFHLSLSLSMSHSPHCTDYPSYESIMGTNRFNGYKTYQ